MNWPNFYRAATGLCGLTAPIDCGLTIRYFDNPESIDVMSRIEERPVTHLGRTIGFPSNRLSFAWRPQARDKNPDSRGDHLVVHVVDGPHHFRSDVGCMVKPEGPMDGDKELGHRRKWIVARHAGHNPVLSGRTRNKRGNSLVSWLNREYPVQGFDHDPCAIDLFPIIGADFMN